MIALTLKIITLISNTNIKHTSLRFDTICSRTQQKSIIYGDLTQCIQQAQWMSTTLMSPLYVKHSGRLGTLMLIEKHKKDDIGRVRKADFIIDQDTIY